MAHLATGTETVMVRVDLACAKCGKRIYRQVPNEQKSSICEECLKVGGGSVDK